MSGARNASDSVIRIERSVLPSRKASDSKVWQWIGQKFVQPAMGVAKGVEENRTRVGAHGPSAGFPSLAL